MLQTACQVYNIDSVTDVQPGNGAWNVTFQSGLVATLPPDHPDRETIQRHIRASLRRKRPVGIHVDAMGKIVELNYTYETAVRSVGDDERPNRLLVGFWAFSSVCYLMRDHPEFERIRTTLADAVGTWTRVVFANRMWPVEDDSESWLEILDVRPLPPLPPDRSLNGVAQDAAARNQQPSWPNP